jgi:hypothetical protein
VVKHLIGNHKSWILKRSGLRWVHVFTFLAGLVVVAMFLGKVGLSGDFWLCFNADTLYLPSIYRDLFVDGSGFRGWHLNASPNFFPDMVIYFVIMAILKAPALTCFVFSLVQFGIVMVLIDWLIRVWDPDAGIEVRILTGLMMVLWMLSPLTGEYPLIPYQLIAPSFHCGVFINSLLVMNTGRLYLRGGRPALLVLTGILTLLAVVSDRLFLVGALFPMVVVALLPGARESRGPRNWLLLAVLLGSSAAGMMAFRWIVKGGALHVIGTGWKMFNFGNAGNSLRNLAVHLGSVILEEPLQRWIIIMAILFFVTAPLFLLRSARAYLNREMELQHQQPCQLVLLLFAASMAVLLTPVINGSYLGPALVRYNFPALVLGDVGFICLSVLILRNARFFKPVIRWISYASVILLLVVMASTGIRNDIPGGIGKFNGYYPERARVIDSLKEAHGLKYGLAGYWAAKPSTLFSKKGMRIYAIHQETLRPNYHVTNENWFHDGGKGSYADPVFNFIVADSTRISSAQLQELFGPGLDTIATLYDEHIIRLPDFKIDRATGAIRVMEPGNDAEGSFRLIIPSAATP